MKRQFRELTRLFFGRFVENDLIALDGDVRAILVNIIALIATPGLIYPMLTLQRYGSISGAPFQVRDMASLPDKAFFILFSMTVLGVLTVIEWEALFPDRRDYTILRPFPIHLATLFGAKIASLAAFWAIFTVAIGGGSMLLVPALVAQKDGFDTLLWIMRCYGLSLIASTAFVFLVLIAAQGLLMNVLGWRWFRKVSPYAQLLLIAALLTMFFSASTLMGRFDGGRANTSVLLFPPAWFLGLCQYQLGWNQPIFRELAARALIGLGLAAAGAAAAYALGYRRHVRKSLEAVETSVAPPGWIAQAITRIADRVALRTPAERAAFHFVRQTVLRSARHKVLLSAWTAVGCALVFHGLAGVVSQGTEGWWRNPQGALLPAPLVLSLFIVCGMRYVFTIPAELKANWIFQVAGKSAPREYMSGVRKAVLLVAVAPWMAVLLAVHLAIWNWTAAAIHILFATTMAWLLTEVLLLSFEKLPFTCSYVPGKANVRSLWPVYITAFVAYVTLFSGFESLILEKPSRLAYLALFAAAVKAGVFLYRRELGAEFEFIFDDRPEPAVRTLDLAQ